MPTAYEILLADLMEIEPLAPIIPTRPSLLRLKFKEKVQHIYSSLIRASQIRQRRNALMHAYYLGELINNATKANRMEAKQIVSSYYYTISTRTHRLFEGDPVQIYRTQLTTPSTISKLKKTQYYSLCPEEVLAGGSN